jgi:cytidylate kinase
MKKGIAEMIIALDGPSGAGKSTVAKAVAQRLGFHCLDTGAMYRAVAWKALESGVDVHDDEATGEIARTNPIGFVLEPGNPYPVKVTIGDADVTTAIRTGRIDATVSAVAANPSVRRALVDQQRRIARDGSYVVEGRDIATVVFPDAEVKVFMTASDQERARRRVEQNKARGVGSTDFDEVYRAILKRDAIDAGRDEAPLEVAEGAVVVDTTDMTFDQVVDKICEMAGEIPAKQEA